MRYLFFLIVGFLSVVSFAQIKQNIVKEIPAEEHEHLFGARIQRTMTLLTTSSPERRNNVKILFYGQSVVANPTIQKIIISRLGEKFPYANIQSESRAIGGYTARLLIRPSEHDIYPYYPDLLIFHVYYGAKQGELERIISEVRRRTTSEILLWTHHLDVSDNERKLDNDRMCNSLFIEYLAQKYNCELVDVRGIWGKLLKLNNLQRKDILVDSIHPNKEGARVMAELLLRHFKFTTIFPSEWYKNIRIYDPRRFAEEGKNDEITFSGEPWKRFRNGVVGESKNSSLKLTFYGNRVDIVAAAPCRNPGTAKLLIDGKNPSCFQDAYASTRPSSTSLHFWPAINRVNIGPEPKEENWTLILHDYSKKKDNAEFELVGSITGSDGKGTLGEDFISDSRKISINKKDFNLSEIEKVSKKKLPDRVEIKWKTYLMGMDQWKPENITDSSKVYNYTIIQGVSNSKHVLEIIPNGNGFVPIKEIVVYQPPLK